MAGIVAGLRGDIAAPEVAHHAAPAGDTRPHHEDSRYRYCTNFIVQGSGLDGRSFVPLLEEIGDSVLVVGDEVTLKVHVHTDEPEGAVALFADAGEVSQLDVADMRAQVAQRDERLLRAGRCSVVAVTSGDGMRELFEGLGAFAVDGGDTFNPSIYDLLAAIHEVALRGGPRDAEQPERGDGGRARGRALGQGREGRGLHRAPGRPRRPARARPGAVSRGQRRAGSRRRSTAFAPDPSRRPRATTSRAGS